MRSPSPYATVPMRQAGRQGGRTSSPPPLASGQPGTSNWDVASHRRYLLPPPPPAPAIGFRQVCHHCSSAVLADSCAPSAVLTPAAGAGAAGAGDTITGALHVGQLGASQLLSHFRMHLQGRGRWRVVRHQSARHGAASRRHPTRGGRPSSCAQRAAPQRAAPQRAAPPEVAGGGGPLGRRAATSGGCGLLRHGRDPRTRGPFFGARCRTACGTRACTPE